MERFYLLAEKIAPRERRMRRSTCARKIAHAVVTFGEQRHTLNVGVGKRARKVFGIEFRRHVVDVRRRMKVKVNLTCQHRRPFASLETPLCRTEPPIRDSKSSQPRAVLSSANISSAASRKCATCSG
jgi:hypothetical protein